MKQTLKAREFTIEFKDVEELGEIQLVNIVSTLRSFKRSFIRQLGRYPEWDRTIRVQAVILCPECSKDKQAKVEFNSSKHIRMTRCLHLNEAKVEV